MYAISEPKTKAVVSVAEMARMVGLSRARFYQLQGTTFPWPLYDVATKRPFYDESLQESCLAIRRRNCGLDGTPVLFYSRRPMATAPLRARKKVASAKDKKHAELLDGLKGLGLGNADGAQIGEALKQIYPNGVEGVGHGEVLRAVFLHLRRQNTGNNVGK